ncbi:putative phosphothreonine lyase domain-containing protein [Methanosphaerula subterraneus]|uniref:putative phosphothreonine lyase domain-containing protein n=1 Tax=Methanosphaerula subterraneus TaxID=3350244 RepID=UPI003F866548
MADVEPEALADVAYGIFEIVLNRELRAAGHPLFRLVEEQVDFADDFIRIFSEFADEYPLLAEALLERYLTPDAIYAMLCAGEGVIPTRTTLMYWIVQDAPEGRPDAVDDELAGKWLIFLEKDRVDQAWQRVRDLTYQGVLGISAKVSTAKPNPDARDDRFVVYVYTPDWQDEGDVMRVREELRSAGFVDRLGYKRNLETFRGEYSKKGKKVTYYSS